MYSSLSSSSHFKHSIYSISEFVKKDIYKYRIIANPGCYPTSIQIPLIPLIKKKLINIKKQTNRKLSLINQELNYE